MNIEPRALGLTGLKDLDEDTAVAVACTVLEGSGYSGAYTEVVIAELSARYDICATAGQSMVTFLSPVFVLCTAGFGDDNTRQGGLLGRVKDVEAMLGVLREANGELRQKLIRR